MKTRESKLILVIIILISLLMVLSINLILNSKVALINGKQIIKEMTEGEYESQLTELNKSHEEYHLQVQENKQKIATAITNQKVATSQDDTIDQIVTNIGKILQAGTADADATADNITAGKKAYVNGKLITGTGADNNSYYESGKEEGKGYNIVNLGGAGTYDLTSYENYENFAINENIFIVTNTISVSASISTRDASGSVKGSGSSSGQAYSVTYTDGILVVGSGSGSCSGTVKDSYESVGSIKGSYAVSSVSVYLIY